jgi:hypothetical protein
MRTNLWCARSILLCAVLLAGVAVSARADSGSLSTGSSYCAAEIQSPNGVFFTGGTGQTTTLAWTVTASATAEGAKTTLYTSKASNLEYVSVKAAAAGTYFYQVCLENEGKPTIGFGLYVNPLPNGATKGYNAGPATAVLGPGANVCQGFSEGPASFAGQSNASVEWFVQLYDGDGDFLGNAFTTNASSINDIVSPIDGAFYVVACATNTSKTETATISFSLLPQ